MGDMDILNIFICTIIVWTSGIGVPFAIKGIKPHFTRREAILLAIFIYFIRAAIWFFINPHGTELVLLIQLFIQIRIFSGKKELVKVHVLSGDKVCKKYFIKRELSEKCLQKINNFGVGYAIEHENKYIFITKSEFIKRRSKDSGKKIVPVKVSDDSKEKYTITIPKLNKKHKTILLVLLICITLCVTCSVVFYNIGSNNSAVSYQDTSAVAYITPTGKKYHTSKCKIIKNNDRAIEITLNKAKKAGYTACSKCKADKYLN